MPTFLEDVKRLFGTDCLYSLLGCDRKFKRAFYKCSLKYHPDRNDDARKSMATEQFQIIARAFSILSNKDSRAAYDETGIVGDSFSEKSFDDWVDYWKLIFPPLTSEKIEEFKRGYIGSQEEREDIAKYYELFRGDMDKIMDSVMFADPVCEDRYREIIQALIDDKKVKAYKAFVNEPARKRSNRLRRAKQEAKEVNKSTSELASAIQAIQQKRLKTSEDLITKLTEKYCQPQKRRQRHGR
ncbi:unnamed protein product [Mesocestoides corti]|uniref:J domain-containing protein n=1 Tax=Mesocestoides corti TaxID=53468 RepID=A0A0R3UIZ3_MESCO|nr:unnamed protein product [Mesocestoides corti]